MNAVMWLAALLAGVIHVLFFLVESAWWTTPAVRRRFRQTPEQAEATKLLAFNQGFYNLFLAAGTFGGLALTLAGHAGPGLAIAAWCCLSMLAAAVVLAASSPTLRRGAVIQGAAPLVFLVLAALHGGWIG